MNMISWEIVVITLLRFKKFSTKGENVYIRPSQSSLSYSIPNRSATQRFSDTRDLFVPMVSHIYYPQSVCV